MSWLKKVLRIGQSPDPDYSDVVCVDPEAAIGAMGDDGEETLRSDYLRVPDIEWEEEAREDLDQLPSRLYRAGTKPTVVTVDAASTIANFQSSVAALAVTKSEKLALAENHLKRAREIVREADAPAALGHIQVAMRSVQSAKRHAHTRPYRKDEQ